MQVEDIKALGFRQMHKLQIDSLLDLIAVTLNLAALTHDQDVIEETEAFLVATVSSYLSMFTDRAG